MNGSSGQQRRDIPASEKEAERYLRECFPYIMPPEGSTARDQLLVLGAIGVVCLAVIVSVYWLVKSEEVIRAVMQVIGICVPLVIAGAALWQWRLVRNEIALDKYYDRLDKANSIAIDHYLEVRGVTSTPGDDGKNYLEKRYVYMHLDTLEYTIEKYKLGYSSARQACRGIDGFRTKLRNSDRFVELSSYAIGKGSYTEETVMLVKVLIEEGQDC